MYLRSVAALAALLVLACTTGCATSRSEIRIGSPVPAKMTASNGRVVVVRSVQDERIFEEAPRDPSTPSLGFGGATQAPAEIKARAIGRKRNSYGMAMGDVLLQPGQSVTTLVKENLETALRQAGLTVANEVARDSSQLVIDVHIKTFWAWLQPGFWAITLNSNITTDLTLSDSAQTTITVHVEDSGMAATEGSWQAIVEKALLQYRAEAAIKAAAFE